jgi:hypothetical protein
MVTSLEPVYHAPGRPHAVRGAAEPGPVDRSNQARSIGVAGGITGRVCASKES